MAYINEWSKWSEMTSVTKKSKVKRAVKEALNVVKDKLEDDGLYGKAVKKLTDHCISYGITEDKRIISLILRCTLFNIKHFADPVKMDKQIKKSF